MTEQPDAPIEAPSDLFQEIVCRAGSLVITCEGCGRTYFGDEGDGDFEDGEYERLCKESETDPKVIGPLDGFTSWGRFDEKELVVDCVCHTLRRYEDFILGHQEQITELLRRTAENALERAKCDLQRVNDIPEVPSD